MLGGLNIYQVINLVAFTTLFLLLMVTWLEEEGVEL